MFIHPWVRIQAFNCLTTLFQSSVPKPVITTVAALITGCACVQQVLLCALRVSAAEVLAVLQRLPVLHALRVGQTGQKHNAAALVRVGQEKVKQKREVVNEPFKVWWKCLGVFGCLSKSCVLVRAGSLVCPTTVKLRKGLSPGLTGADMKVKTSSLASNTPSISFRRQQRPSAHLSHWSLWTSPSTVSFRDTNSNLNKFKFKLKNNRISVAHRCKLLFCMCFTVKAKPPVGLSFRDAGDGGWRLTWSSPYPPSSSLNKNITYEVSYQGDGESHWVVSIRHGAFSH